MTREKEILNEIYYQNHLVDIDAESFIRGAEWADNQPKSPWISVKDDLPCNHEELIQDKSTELIQDKSTKKVIVVDKYDGVIVDFMRNVNKLWHWRHAVHALYWMPIPELPKE